MLKCVCAAAGMVVIFFGGNVSAQSKADEHQKSQQRDKLCRNIKSDRPYGATSKDDATTQAIVEYCSQYFKAFGITYPKS